MRIFATMDDVKMQDVLQTNDLENGPIFSKQEQEILNLYDQVQKLELELALTKARVRLASERTISPRTIHINMTTHSLYR